MIFNIQHTANWEYIRARKQRLIQKNNKNENKSQVPHTYHVDDKVMLRKGTKNKYEAPFSGPHKILKVNTNGTVNLRVGSVTDTVNICRIEPYKEVSDSIHGVSAICDFPRREDKLMTELMNHKRSTS
jgi:hypothetical protein